jgi:hypothetical protein
LLPRVRQRQSRGTLHIGSTAKEAGAKVMSVLRELKLMPETAMKEEER